MIHFDVKLLFYLGAVILGVTIGAIGNIVHAPLFSVIMIGIIVACVYTLAMEQFLGDDEL